MRATRLDGGKARDTAPGGMHRVDRAAHEGRPHRGEKQPLEIEQPPSKSASASAAANALQKPDNYYRATHVHRSLPYHYPPGPSSTDPEAPIRRYDKPTLSPRDRKPPSLARRNNLNFIQIALHTAASSSVVCAEQMRVPPIGSTISRGERSIGRHSLRGTTLGGWCPRLMARFGALCTGEENGA